MKTQNFKDVLKGDSFGQKTIQMLINGSVTEPLDLTGVIIRIQFRKQNKTGLLLKTLTNGDGITIIDATEGKFSIDDFIVNFPVDIYYYDVQFASGTVIKTRFGGTMKVIQDVTQNT